MLQINGKTFMNLQEAVQWLLDNNALPFQSSANYVANTEIGMGTIVNPSPAKVRIGSLIFFADSKVSTVIGLTENGFIVSDQYNDLVDDVVYVSNVALNASGHLIVTLSNGDDIDAGQIKMISSFSIDASQHLIANYNDGTSTDLGAIFTGNVNISGDLTVSGTIDGGSVTGDEIVEKMSGYGFINGNSSGITIDYAGVCKNGNKITFVVAGVLKRNNSTPYSPTLCAFTVPAEISAKIYPIGTGTTIDAREVAYFDLGNYASTPIKRNLQFYKETLNPNQFSIQLKVIDSDFTLDKDYFFRYECTFLLSDNLAQ